MNQVLAHVGNTPFDLIDYCRSKGILVEAYSPVAHGAALADPVLGDMAARYGVGVAQLCIRYCLQLGLLPLPKTADPEHMRDNAAVDFAISDADMAALTRGHAVGGAGDHGGDRDAARPAGHLGRDRYRTSCRLGAREFRSGCVVPVAIEALSGAALTERHSDSPLGNVLARLPLFFLPDVGDRINPALPAIAARAAKRHPGLSVTVSDRGPHFEGVRAEAAQRGFTDVTTACAGRAIFREDPTPCAAPASHFFYRGGHPSTEAHRQTGALLAAEARRSWCAPRAKASGQ